MTSDLPALNKLIHDRDIPFISPTLEDRDRELIISQLSGVLLHSGSGRGEPGDFAATRIAGSPSRRDLGLSAGVLHTIPNRILVAGHLPDEIEAAPLPHSYLIIDRFPPVHEPSGSSLLGRGQFVQPVCTLQALRTQGAQLKASRPMVGLASSLKRRR